MQDLQAGIILARTRLTDNSPFGDYCPAEVCPVQRFCRALRQFSFEYPDEFGRRYRRLQ
jgi:hypothetical protein